MNIRPLDLLDLPTLYRYRGEVLSLDSARMLTRGNPLGAAGFMSYLNPVRHIYSAVASENGTTLLGGVIHTNGDPFAKLLYLAPANLIPNPGLPALIEHLAAEAGNWGAFHVLAEVDENSPAFPALRMAGFSVYAWQRVWNLSEVSSSEVTNGWQKVDSLNLPAIQSLHHQIVPPLLQPVEPAPRRASGMVCMEGGRCFVNVAYGLNGIMLTPLIHPEAADVTHKLVALINHIPNRRGRPVYLCVRSYQAWLEPVLEDLGAKASQRQAVMVKHLARMVREEQTSPAVQRAPVIPASRYTPIQKKK